MPAHAEDYREQLEQTCRAHRLMNVNSLAGALAIGIVMGWYQPQPWVRPWLISSALALIVSIATRNCHRTWMCVISLLLATAFFAAAWATLRQHYVSEHDLAAAIVDEPTIVRLTGSVTRPGETRPRVAGSMARFDFRAPATYFTVEIDRLHDSQGGAIAVTGSVLVRVDESIQPLHAGDRVTVTGYFLKPMPPRNPGEFDSQEYARAIGQAGMVTVPDRDLISVQRADGSHFMNAMANFRQMLQRRASAWLLSNLPSTQQTNRDALLISLMLGERDPQMDDVQQSFQRVGLAHILAISGFHLGVLAGFVVLAARGAGCARCMQGMLVIGFVILYLMIVEVRMPVLRAGIMTMAASCALLAGRRLNVGGLIALSAIILLLWRPDQLFNPGFQLTYGVVLALVHLVPPVRARFFGNPDPFVATSAQMLGQWLRTAVAVSVVAWLVATPISAYHFGLIAPLGVILSVIAVPLAALMLGLGFCKMALAALLPSIALILGVPLAVCSEILLTIVNAIDGISVASYRPPLPSILWTAPSLGFVFAWSLSKDFRARRWLGIGWPVLIVWLTLVPQLFASKPKLRVDMLAVGDGSCIVVRSGSRTLVFDAGSSSDLNAGRRSIVPALRALGVTWVDALAISHADLDHYSAALEVADAFRVDRVLVTPQLLESAELESDSPLHEMVRGIRAKRIPIESVSQGSTLQLGHARMTWLHPHAEGQYRRSNDGSMVIRVEAAGRSLLLTGDIERAAMATLMGNPGCEKLQADILELPHHGSYSDVAHALVNACVQPRIILQSTGFSRLRDDRWREVLDADTQRFITARDGACWVEVMHDGSLSCGSFLK